jgi:hypothetical protein
MKLILSPVFSSCSSAAQPAPRLVSDDDFYHLPSLVKRQLRRSRTEYDYGANGGSLCRLESFIIVFVATRILKFCINYP